MMVHRAEICREQWVSSLSEGTGCIQDGKWRRKKRSPSGGRRVTCSHEVVTHPPTFLFPVSSRKEDWKDLSPDLHREVNCEVQGWWRSWTFAEQT